MDGNGRLTRKQGQRFRDTQCSALTEIHFPQTINSWYLHQLPPCLALLLSALYSALLVHL
jgi:hypothetical protein